MAHSLSAKKRVRQNEKLRSVNRARRSAVKTVERTLSDILAKGDAAAAETQFRAVCKRLDREATKGLIHRNAAARTKSRLAKRLAAMKAPAAK